jgi:cytochrome c oxidase subunit IV
MAHRYSAEELAQEQRRYLHVFAWLAILTLVELTVVHAPIARMAIGGMLVVLAATKAALVALYYMHLVHERRTLMYIALTPAVLCVFLVLMLTPDLGSVRRAVTHLVASAEQAEVSHH